jgi:acyl-coenzyme A synthetase/AMP-(fatty) acid ligase
MILPYTSGNRGESRGRGGAATETAVVAKPDELTGGLVVAFVVLTEASGASGELPGGAVSTIQNRSGCSPYSGMIPKSSARASRTAKTTMNTIRRASRRRAMCR